MSGEPYGGAPNPGVKNPLASSYQWGNLPQQELDMLRSKLVESIIQVVVTDITGVLLPGPAGQQLASWAIAVLEDIGGFADQFTALISALGVALWSDVVSLITWVVNIIHSLQPGNFAGFPRSFGSAFDAPGNALADLVTHAQLQPLLDGIANLAGRPGSFSNVSVDAAVAGLQQLPHTIESNISQAIQDGVAGVEGAGAALTQSLQSFPGQNVLALGGDSIVNNVQAVVDGFVNGLNATEGLVGAGIADAGASLSSFLTTQFNNWTGGNKTNAGAADISAAALSAAEQAASLSRQAAAILAQLPQFYGGSGAAGIGIEVPFVGGVPQGVGSSFTEISSTQYQYNGIDGYNGTATAQTDSETVSGIWSTIIPADTWRGVYLRANTSGSTRVWARWRVVGDPGAGSSGGYYIPNDAGAYFEFQIGCTVAGFETVLQTFGPYYLWTYAGNVVVTGYSIHFVGVWWANYPVYTQDYGPGWTANTGYTMYLNSGNNSISLDVVADSFSLNYPGAGQLTKTDSGPVSFMGTAYRQAGFTDDAGVPGSQVSWAFWDSGPTSGPQTEPLATSETTSSATWADLGTVGPDVTVNVGGSGMVLVTVSGTASNNTGGCRARMGFAALGSNTIAAGANQNLLVAQDGKFGGSAQTLVTGLLPGPTAFTAKYEAPDGGVSTFSDRDITAIPL